MPFFFDPDEQFRQPRGPFDFFQSSPLAMSPEYRPLRSFFEAPMLSGFEGGY